MSQTSNSGSGRTVAIIAMFFLFAMISFVTNLAAPIGTIWGFQFAGNSFLGMLGNMMNFLAYLFMGIPAGKLLTKIGYKKTALWAMAIGAIGLAVQLASSWIGETVVIHSSDVVVKDNIDQTPVELVKHINVTLSFIIYLLGAFIAGFCVCMLNTVVNPMLNLLGGGGNKGNQLIQTGGALNSLSATLTPFFVGALIGQLTSMTTIARVSPLLWIAVGVFVVAFIVISFVKIPEPNITTGKKVKFTHSPWSFRHTVLGVIAIFFYVGVEVGIPSTLNFYLADQNPEFGAGILGDASAIAGAVVAIYWLLMLVGRFTSGIISGKVSTRTQLLTVSSVCIILVGLAIFSSKESTFNVPSIVYNPVKKTEKTLKNAGLQDNEIAAFMESKDKNLLYAQDENNTYKFLDARAETSSDGKQVTKYTLKNSDKQPYELVIALDESNRPSIPYSALFLILCGLCTSVMWGGIFNLAVEGLGKYTAQASGIFMMMVVGGGVLPQLQQLLVNHVGYMQSYYLIIGAVGYIFLYAVWGCINVNTDIPTGTEEEEDARKEIKDEISLVD